MLPDTNLWKIVKDTKSEQLYLWNSFFGYSVWLLELFAKKEMRDSILSAEMIWKLYKKLHQSNVFLQCYVCSGNAVLKNTKQCSRCYQVIHSQCYNESLLCCRFCGPKMGSSGSIDYTFNGDCYTDDIHTRLGTIIDEFSADLQSEFNKINDKTNLSKLRSISFRHFQGSFIYFDITPISSKNYTLGVVATRDIQPFTRICIYPGYRDIFAGYQCKYGRQIPRYSVDVINCANHLNQVFDEFKDISGPFINEPSEFEKANCGWMREHSALDYSRYTIITVRKVLKGQELLINYGPEYLRDYTYAYDHYVFLPTDFVEGMPSYNLFRWQNKMETNPFYICRIVYCSESDSYVEFSY